MRCYGSDVSAVDSSSESDDADDNFYAMSDVRKRNHGNQWQQDHVQRQSRVCVTLSISKGCLLGCTASQVYTAFLSVFSNIFKKFNSFVIY